MTSSAPSCPPPGRCPLHTVTGRHGERSSSLFGKDRAARLLRRMLRRGISRFGAARPTAETGVRRGDADRNAPSHPEHREITHYEGHETRIGTHLTLDQQTDEDGDRLPDHQRDEKGQQQLGAFHDCAPCIDCVRASLGGTPRNQSRRDDKFRSACRHNVAGAVTERQDRLSEDPDGGGGAKSDQSRISLRSAQSALAVERRDEFLQAVAGALQGDPGRQHQAGIRLVAARSMKAITALAAAQVAAPDWEAAGPSPVSCPAECKMRLGVAT
jgi:hypothetical protein